MHQALHVAEHRLNQVAGAANDKGANGRSANNHELGRLPENFQLAVVKDVSAQHHADSKKEANKKLHESTVLEDEAHTKPDHA